jgi:hypothetical protein
MAKAPRYRIIEHHRGASGICYRLHDMTRGCQAGEAICSVADAFDARLLESALQLYDDVRTGRVQTLQAIENTHGTDTNQADAGPEAGSSTRREGDSIDVC